MTVDEGEEHSLEVPPADDVALLSVYKIDDEVICELNECTTSASEIGSGNFDSISSETNSGGIGVIERSKFS
ncbi:unnamed protein product [Parnassius apollo]|uniref:(apollo) hypothetical protein n=1 Tax=Parnassius apollo TaxID=110799 RepID=A0A8S3XQZ0_PARAO|nr:unnamed protein product [Parnassius apollo]